MPAHLKLTQKQVERWQFDRFVELAGLLLQGEIVESEEPDFLIATSTGILGVELTDLFWEQKPGVTPQQAVEALRARIAEQAGRIYSSLGLQAIHVSVHFSPHYVPSKRDVPRLSQAIAELVAINVPKEGEHFREDYDWENRAYFPEEINHIGAWRLPGSEQSFFSSPGAAMIPVLDGGDIERALALKEPKLENYRRACNEAWLVINCDGGQLATVFEHDEAVLGQEYLSGFDRAFLVRQMARRVHELRLRRPGG